MTIWIVVGITVIGFVMGLTRRFGLVLWPLWGGGLLLCLTSIYMSEQAQEPFVGHPGSSVRLVILTSALYFLLAGAAGRILRSIKRESPIWQRAALGLAIMLLALPFIGIVMLEMGQT